MTSAADAHLGLLSLTEPSPAEADKIMAAVSERDGETRARCLQQQVRQLSSKSDAHVELAALGAQLAELTLHLRHAAERHAAATRSAEEHAALDVIARLAYPSIFKTLRTQQQLGYLVSGYAARFDGIAGGSCLIYWIFGFSERVMGFVF